MKGRLEPVVAIWALLGGVILIAIVLVTVVNVSAFSLDRLARLAGMNVSGLSGYEDFVRLGISAAALMFFPYCQFQRAHVKADILVRHLSSRIQQILDSVWLTTTAIIALGLSWYMLEGLKESRSDNLVSPVLGWPEWPFYIPGIISLLLWALVCMVQFRQRSDGASQNG